MKRHASQFSLILATLAIAPAALAGSEIVKCIEQSGHITLTDQPCGGSAATVQLASLPPAPAGPAATSESVDAADADAAPVAAPLAVERQVVSPDLLPSANMKKRAVQRYVASPGLLPSATWTKPASAAPLARDVATMKEARAQLLLLDSARPQRQARLAGLN